MEDVEQDREGQDTVETHKSKCSSTVGPPLMPSVTERQAVVQHRNSTGYASTIDLLLRNPQQAHCPSRAEARTDGARGLWGPDAKAPMSLQRANFLRNS